MTVRSLLLEPYGRHAVAHTADLDEAREAVSSVYLPHRIQPLDHAPDIEMCFNAISLGSVTVGYLRYGRNIRMTTADALNYHVNIPLAGGTESRCGAGDTVVTTTSRAAVFMPDQPADIRWSAECAQLCIMIPRVALERELEQLRGEPLASPLQFANGMDLTTRLSQSWLGGLDLLERESACSISVVQQPLAARHLEHFVLAGLLLAQPHNYSEDLARPYPPPRPRHIRQVIDLIESRPERPWTAPELASCVTVSVRSLQEGFARFVGMSPMTYLRVVRLSRVHGELESADPESLTVSEVAHRWGFSHLGRFTKAYRHKFGVLPSETLRSARPPRA